MICIVLSKPSPSGFVPVYGFTTSADSVTLPTGTTCDPGYIASVGSITSQFDSSGAQGNVSQGLLWPFEIADYDGTERRSIGILDGSERFVGWQVTYWRDSGAAWAQADIGDMRVSNVSSGGSSVSFEALSQWVLNTQTVGLGAEGQRVGIVVGGHDVSVPTLELADLAPFEYAANSGWFQGNGDTFEAAPKTATTATRKENGAFVFVCRSSIEAAAFHALITSTSAAGTVVIFGDDCVESVASVTTIGADVFVPVSDEFYDIEDPENVQIAASSTAAQGVIGAADALTGFVGDDGATISVIGESSTSDFVLSFSPSLRSPDGFRAYSKIDCALAWASLDPGYDDPPTAFFGSSLAVVMDGGSLPAYGAYDNELEPSASSSWTMWCRLGQDDPLSATLKLITAPRQNFVRYVVDVSDRLVVNQAFSMSGAVTTRALGRMPFTFGTGNSFASAPLLNSSDPVLRNEWTLERGFTGPGVYASERAFASIDEINDSIGLRVASETDRDIMANYQIRGINIYGITSLSFGSSFAVVTPGSSPWWAGQAHPLGAAFLLLNEVAGEPSFSVPSYLPDVSECGDYIAPETSFVEAAVELAERYWFHLSPDGAYGANGTADGELVKAPTIALSNDSDIATEITVKYDEWAGEFRQTAYISNVHEEFDEANAARFYGGWGVDGEDFGRTIWNACRNAWKTHGIRKSKTFELPGVHDSVVVGKMWTARRAGAMRCEWLAFNSAFVTFEVSERGSSWWAGSTVYIPQTMASLQGYDLTAFASTPLLVVSKEHDLIAETSRFEVHLPPITSTGTSPRIVQTLNGGDDRIAQTLTPSDDRIVQILEA